ncbi:MAG: tripartite tricarboxylate transporter substrate binding protein [Comamonadaceae bacterium]|jgi:tripartite-type tricarboxylate transporter receptor subunit TctC|nr:tripartite tricarboxylate transporter substrate binding protein [Comamonadaceae bacterium]
MRHLMSCVAALAALAAPVTSSAQAAAAAAFPTKPLRMLVPVPAGGPSDFIARQVAQQLSASLGQAVTVENKPGANGLLAAREAMAAPADGHTLLYAPGSMIATPLLVKASGLDWSRDFAPLGKVGRVPFALAIYPGVPASTLAEFVKQAHQQPHIFNVATSTPSEVLAAAQFMQAAGVQLTRVPYRGGTQALPDLLTGRVQVMFGPLSMLQAQAKSGALRVLAVLDPERSAALPDVPTMAEVGMGAVSVPTWQGVYTVAKVPEAVRARLAADIAAAVARPELRSEFERRMLAPEGATPKELTATITRELAVWSALVDAYKLTAD